jgi:RNA polymerase sigma-70 factor (ECF subfamily)
VGCALAERFDSGILMRMARESAEDAPSDPDAALVERICCGDGRAFETVVRRYQRPLYYLALRYVRNEADAADVTQRAFVRVHKSIRSFRGAASFRTWIYRIAINLSLNHLRDRKRERPSEIADDALTTSAVGINGLVADERRARLREAIDTLPPKQKLVIELRIYDELTFREVAELADCTENAAKVNFHHGMQRLRSLLAGDEP